MRYLAAGLPALVAFAARVLTGPHPIDDAYITFRYARNFAEGVGLVYNPGEWVLGTTTPLWALLLAAGYKVGLTDLPWLATVLSALFDAASVALLVHLALRLGWRAWGAALVGLAWALNPTSVAFASGGMEASLFVLVSLGTLTLCTSGKLGSAAALAGLATLVRPEGALLVVVVVAWSLRAGRTRALRSAIVAGVPIVVAGLTLYLWYGSPLPHSMAAKQVAYRPAEPLDNALAFFVQAGLPGWSDFLLSVMPTAAALAVAIFGVATFGFLVWRALPRRRLFYHGQTWQPFAAFAVLYIAFYVVAGFRGVRLFNWYMVPIEPFYLLAAASGLASVRAQWVAALLVLWQLPAIDWHQPLLPAGENLVREQLYYDVGRDLRQSLPSTALVASPEIGALGYASNLPMLDTVGLVSPAALPYYPLPDDQLVTDNAIPARLITDRQPDAVVTLDAYALRSLLPDPEFQQDYVLAADYPAVVWQSHELLVYLHTPEQ